MSALAPALQAFFTQRLITQRDASPHTIAAYRDTFRLLLRFAQQQTGKQPFQLDIDDLDAPLIGAFLTHLEHDRGNSPRTRNARLGAIHSFYRFAALEHPEHAHTIARIMAIPTKRHERNTVSYLDTGRDHGTARRARSPHLARPPRPRAAGADDPNRDPRLRTHRPAHRRCPPRRRRPHPRHRQGTKDALTHAHPRNRRGPTRLAQGTATANPTSRCSPPGKVGRSAATPSARSSPDTSPRQPSTARR